MEDRKEFNEYLSIDEIKYGYDYKGKDKADLLIDPLNPKNYFIDFNITEN